MREESRVRKVREARGIISHGVGWTRDVIMPGNIAVVSLMYTKEAEEMCWCFLSGGAAFPLPEQRCKVVCLAQDGSLSYVVLLGYDIKVKESTC